MTIVLWSAGFEEVWKRRQATIGFFWGELGAERPAAALNRISSPLACATGLRTDEGLWVAIDSGSAAEGQRHVDRRPPRWWRRSSAGGARGGGCRRRAAHRLRPKDAWFPTTERLKRQYASAVVLVLTLGYVTSIFLMQAFDAHAIDGRLRAGRVADELDDDHRLQHRVIEFALAGGVGGAGAVAPRVSRNVFPGRRRRFVRDRVRRALRRGRLRRGRQVQVPPSRTPNCADEVRLSAIFLSLNMAIEQVGLCASAWRASCGGRAGGTGRRRRPGGRRRHPGQPGGDRRVGRSPGQGKTSSRGVPLGRLLDEPAASRRAGTQGEVRAAARLPRITTSAAIAAEQRLGRHVRVMAKKKRRQAGVAEARCTMAPVLIDLILMATLSSRDGIGTVLRVQTRAPVPPVDLDLMWRQILALLGV